MSKTIKNMYVSFDDISAEARIWIYQADRSLSTHEVVAIEDSGRTFGETWEAHGKTLHASVKVFHGQFLVIAVDEQINMTTGCSIDSSVAFVRKIASEYELDLFDRTKIAFMVNNEVHLTPMNNIKSQVQDGKITKDTSTFNNLLIDKKSLEEQWLIPAENTWLAKYF
jgi:hypothetical protein